MRKPPRLILITAICLLATTAAAQPRSPWQELGQSSDAETLFIDTRTIRNVEYPVAAGDIIASKAYREAWVKLVNQYGTTVGRFLWVFDCEGSWAQVKTAGGPDLTSDAKTAGLGKLLRPVSSDFLAKLVQESICKNDAGSRSG